MVFNIPHSQGCLPHISHCNGLCPSLPSLPTESVTQQTNQSRNLNKQKLTLNKLKTKQHQRRILCGNSCLTKEEARNKYHCGGVCQVQMLLKVKYSILINAPSYRSSPSHAVLRTTTSVHNTSTFVGQTHAQMGMHTVDSAIHVKHCKSTQVSTRQGCYRHRPP